LTALGRKLPARSSSRSRSRTPRRPARSRRSRRSRHPRPLSATLGWSSPAARPQAAWPGRRRGCGGRQTCGPGRRLPTCAACAGFRVPAPAPALAQAAARRYSTTTSSPSRPTLQTCCLPSPRTGLSPAPTTTEAPPRPVPSADDGPAHPPKGGEGDTGRIPRSLPLGRQGRRPAFPLAASPRVRRRPSSWPPSRPS
jgi:hypothetical protein